ncbi:hypothetical protein RDV64_23490 (plasmid) [Acuticoccus sp. MNP-M23]|uniref:hypothetical protein n=1 Tax=Acuticoccus sp. MNP-M23 TaxID=3072793 RepID=UPI002815851B|nr:hypothetical protein [Acuticoccus sp. MNP-M23]WMS45340.1 hypothetical protein RDV64_23490 [Acuticoccus sp. MNP-M23]
MMKLWISIPLVCAAMTFPLAITAQPLLSALAAGHPFAGTSNALFQLTAGSSPAAEPPRAISAQPIPHITGELLCLELRLEGSAAIRVASARTITALRWQGYRADSATEP